MRQKAGMFDHVRSLHMLGDNHPRWVRSGRSYRRKGICQMDGSAQEKQYLEACGALEAGVKKDQSNAQAHST